MEPNKKHHYGIMLDRHDETRVLEEKKRDDRASMANTIIVLMREGLRARWAARNKIKSGEANGNVPTKQ